MEEEQHELPSVSEMIAHESTLIMTVGMVAMDGAVENTRGWISAFLSLVILQWCLWACASMHSGRTRMPLQAGHHHQRRHVLDCRTPFWLLQPINPNNVIQGLASVLVLGCIDNRIILVHNRLDLTCQQERCVDCRRHRGRQ